MAKPRCTITLTLTPEEDARLTALVPDGGTPTAYAKHLLVQAIGLTEFQRANRADKKTMERAGKRGAA